MGSRATQAPFFARVVRDRLQLLDILLQRHIEVNSVWPARRHELLFLREGNRMTARSALYYCLSILHGCDLVLGAAGVFLDDLFRADEVGHDIHRYRNYY